MSKDFLKFAERVRGNLEKATEKETRLDTVKKNNGVVLYGVTVIDEDYNIHPTLYIERFYEMYKDGQEFKEVFMEIYNAYMHDTIHRDVDIDFFKEYEQVRPLLGFKLINADMNAVLLKEVPHKRVYNFAVVSYCDVPKELGLGTGCILIKNQHLDIWGIKPEVLIEDAMQNMQETSPAEFLNMARILKELYDDPKGLIASKLPMYVLTNTERVFGAGALLYDNQLEKVAEEIKEDFYVLPSSIHEVIILPKKYGSNKDYMVQMVREINGDNLSMEERLADNVYIYSRENKELQIVY